MCWRGGKSQRRIGNWPLSRPTSISTISHAFGLTNANSTITSRMLSFATSKRTSPGANWRSKWRSKEKTTARIRTSSARTARSPNSTRRPSSFDSSWTRPGKNPSTCNWLTWRLSSGMIWRNWLAGRMKALTYWYMTANQNNAKSSSN